MRVYNSESIRNLLQFCRKIGIVWRNIFKETSISNNSLNIKGNKYFESIRKFYAVDIGLRNAKLNFRQQEITHIMEDVIYNELRMMGFAVDIGLVEAREMRNGKTEYIQYEVDFIANNGTEKYYIQSAFALDDEEKRQQELNSLLRIDDSFRKVVIVGSDIAEYTDGKGIRFMGLFQFLLSGL